MIIYYIFFFFFCPLGNAYCYIIFRCVCCTRNPAPGRMRYILYFFMYVRPICYLFSYTTFIDFALSRKSCFKFVSNPTCCMVLCCNGSASHYGQCQALETDLHASRRPSEMYISFLNTGTINTVDVWDWRPNYPPNGCNSKNENMICRK